MGGVSRRVAEPRDEAFLRELDVAVRAPHFTGPGWDAGSRADILEMQFAARRSHRAACFPQAREEIILLDGRPAGAVVAHVDGDEVHVLDLAVLPGLWRRGVGSAALAAVVGERAARVEVESANAGARRFYERLGFEVVGDDGVTVALRRASGRATG